ncbi:MAG TPA: FHA domain-containing protein, partial [Lacipirellulaceae bacterium]|nr:FHA domain-containing protein [Lacipirellulaceae bacterium]
MSDVLIAQAENDRWELPLRRESLRLGSVAGSDLRVPHSEVAPHAATLDCRGESVLICNNNEFPIYVGERRVEPNAWLDWHDGETVLLTRQVTLQLRRAKPSRGRGDAGEGAGKDASTGQLSSRQMTQVAVLAPCGLIALFALVQDSVGPRARTGDYDGPP